MQRLNFTLDNDTIKLLDEMSVKFYKGNKSLTVRSALESLAKNMGHEGWVVAGYLPSAAENEERCHTCGETQADGSVVYRPVFERGKGPKAVGKIPSEQWIECASCVEATAK